MRQGEAKLLHRHLTAHACTAVPLACAGLHCATCLRRPAPEQRVQHSRVQLVPPGVHRRALVPVQVPSKQGRAARAEDQGGAVSVQWVGGWASGAGAEQAAVQAAACRRGRKIKGDQCGVPSA